MYRQQHSLRSNTQKGQALVLAVGLFAIAGIMFFLMFNSGRAVNEKINLVNAADSAAYSGAQIAARNLNFMAYTNRAMIANEVAIGHLFSYEVELQVLGQVFDKGFNSGGQLGGLVSAIYQQLFPLFSQDAGAANLELFMEGAEWLAGMMIVLYDINNDRYSGFQDQAFASLVRPNSAGNTVINDTMTAIARTYEAQPNSLIKVNDETTFNAFQGDDVPVSTTQAIEEAVSINENICSMILFANPSGAPLGDGRIVDGSRGDLCAGLSGGNANPDTVDDNGLMIAAIQATYQDPNNYTGGIWINDRNVLDYNVEADGQIWGTGTRVGQTTMEFRNNQMNWFAQDDSLTLNLDTQHTFNHSSDATSTIQSFSNSMNWLNVMLLNLLGLCNNSQVSCSELRNAQYDSIQRFAALNAERESAFVTAFLEQSNCSDGIGTDENGQPLEGWRNNMTSLDEKRQFCGPEQNVYAIARAEVFYERPDCYGNSQACTTESLGFQPPGVNQREAPNLFNPFWQVRLVQDPPPVAGG